MSVYSETFVKASKKNRRCAGCDNFVTISIGDAYWSCFWAEGGEALRYGLCVPCHEHLRTCKACREAIADGCGLRDIRECRLNVANSETLRMVPA